MCENPNHITDCKLDQQRQGPEFFFSVLQHRRLAPSVPTRHGRSSPIKKPSSGVLALNSFLLRSQLIEMSDIELNPLNDLAKGKNLRNTLLPANPNPHGFMCPSLNADLVRGSPRWRETRWSPPSFSKIHHVLACPTGSSAW